MREPVAEDIGHHQPHRGNHQTEAEVAVEHVRSAAPQPQAHHQDHDPDRHERREADDPLFGQRAQIHIVGVHSARVEHLERPDAMAEDRRLLPQLGGELPEVLARLRRLLQAPRLILGLQPPFAHGIRNPQRIGHDREHQDDDQRTKLEAGDQNHRQAEGQLRRARVGVKDAIGIRRRRQGEQRLLPAAPRQKEQQPQHQRAVDEKGAQLVRPQKHERAAHAHVVVEVETPHRAQLREKHAENVGRGQRDHDQALADLAPRVEQMRGEPEQQEPVEELKDPRHRQRTGRKRRIDFGQARPVGQHHPEVSQAEQHDQR
ncbi:MAG: hypothetical protein BWZ08_02680 [candidate division BRC1 bacterium ADurb.BinA292]|nr:MAG: hypothetical protein BWZ08_02680 [candidate division BRC1 bacterium ADurb.BinA292]